MSQLRLNVIDADDAIYGTVDGSVADAVIAALSAEPETIAELECALERYIKRIDDRRLFDSFRRGECFEPWDAGVIIIDLPARLIAIDSSYSVAPVEGDVVYHDGNKATDIELLYRIPDDWLFIRRDECGRLVCDEYLGQRDRRRAERAANPPMDPRDVLYGNAMLEFIAKECADARDSSDPPIHMDSNPDESQTESDTPSHVEDLIRAIHARWLTTPRADLRGKSPREVILEKKDFIDFDLHTRELQWSTLREGPPPLLRNSFAYRFAGFGTNEYVIYYDLLRHLLNQCVLRIHTEEPFSIPAQAETLEASKQSWLNEPNDEFGGRIPAAIIESERRRMPMSISAREMLIDEDCDLCRLAAGETGLDLGPGFWHLDGCNMDQDFEFSTHLTREEWEAEQRRWQEFNEEFNRKWAAEHPSEDDANESA
jgi:hypothetical protein